MVPSSTSEELVLRCKGEGHWWVVAHEDSVAMSCDIKPSGCPFEPLPSWHICVLALVLICGFLIGTLGICSYICEVNVAWPFQVFWLWFL